MDIKGITYIGDMAGTSGTVDTGGIRDTDQEDASLVYAEIVAVLYKELSIPIERKTTIYLERRRRLSENITRSTFTWQIVPTVNIQKGSVNYVGELRNVTSMRIYSFTFFTEYNTDGVSFTAYKNNIQILISPHEAQSFINGKCRFHFVGNVMIDAGVRILTGNEVQRVKFVPGSYQNGNLDNKIMDYPYNRSSDLVDTFYFNQPTTLFNAIGVTLYNNFTPVSLPQDLFKMVATTVGDGLGGDTVTIDTPSIVSPGTNTTVIYIEGFTTSNPTADISIINLLNRTEGFFGTAAGSYSIFGLSGYRTQPAIDWSAYTLVGTPIFKDATVYIDMFNFHIPLEVTYIA